MDTLCSVDDKCKTLIRPKLMCVVFGTFNVPTFQKPDISDEEFIIPSSFGPTPATSLLLTRNWICSLLKVSLLGQVIVPTPYPPAILVFAGKATSPTLLKKNIGHNIVSTIDTIHEVVSSFEKVAILLLFIA